jgi:ABC-type multidrug transport system fused ATPase/permease subunit
VRNNIAYGAEGRFTQEQVEAAARAANAHAFITELPEGYDTILGERGTRLSGGQRQRLAIARTLLRGTPVLLLDEATSQVDVQTEEEILRGLLARASHRAVVFVTHRVATASLADHICVIDGGRTAAFGTHQELLRDDATYRRLLHAAQPADELRRVRALGAT